MTRDDRLRVATCSNVLDLLDDPRQVEGREIVLRLLQGNERQRRQCNPVVDESLRNAPTR